MTRLADVLAGSPYITLNFPGDLVGDALPLLQAERAEFEAVLGVPVVFNDNTHPAGPAWIAVRDDRRPYNSLTWDPAARRLTSTVRDASGLMSTFSLLHSLVALGVDHVTDEPHRSMTDAVDRIRREIAGTYPGFGLRGLDWDGICARHLARDPETMTYEDLQRWIAGLGDAHTAIRRPVATYHPPYLVEITTAGAVMRSVPEGTAAFHAGVRAGWMLDIDRPDDWLARTGATPQGKDCVAGRRAIALEGVTERGFAATSPAGDVRRWVERVQSPSLASVWEERDLDAEMGYVSLRAWVEGIGVEDAFSEAFHRFRHKRRLMLDLRGNTGGSLMLATETRRRFLREPTRLGSIRFSRGDGTLADSVPLQADQHDTLSCWPGELVVLVNGMTYSASEDFALGLQGLPHVTVVGSPSGGGSGRPRSIRIMADVLLTVSTALTFDRTSRCIECNGIPVDRSRL